jgi:hypothetical protein
MCQTDSSLPDTVTGGYGPLNRAGPAASGTALGSGGPSRQAACWAGGSSASSAGQRKACHTAAAPHGSAHGGPDVSLPVAMPGGGGVSQTRNLSRKPIRVAEGARSESESRRRITVWSRSDHVTCGIE